MTDAKKDIMEASKQPCELFIQSQIKRVINGWESELCFQAYTSWARAHNRGLFNDSNFGKNIKRWCEHKQFRREGRRPYIYKLKQDQILNFEIPQEEEEIVE
jgi:hypothetical protein